MNNKFFVVYASFLTKNENLFAWQTAFEELAIKATIDGYVEGLEIIENYTI